MLRRAISYDVSQQCSREVVRFISTTAFRGNRTKARNGAIMMNVYRPFLPQMTTTTTSLRFFSDRLLGYSPMAPSIPTAQSSYEGNADAPKPKIPTAQELSTVGGVWAPTSAKRDKLVELKAALEKDQTSLDDVATPEQKLDLYLADGLQLISKAADSTSVADTASSDIFVRLEEYLNVQSASLPEMVDEATWNAHLTAVSTEITKLLSLLPHGRYLPHVRDFYDTSLLSEDEKNLVVVPSSDELDTSEDALQNAFINSVVRFRLQLADAAAQHLKASWKVLTTVSDGDIDRAAVVGSTLDKQATTLSLARGNDVLRSYAFATCTDRVESWWNLMDRDGDGLLDQYEMDQIASLSIAPVQAAIVTLFQEALESYPVRATLPPLGDDKPVSQPMGWRQRRKERNIKKGLTRLFKRAAKNHFADEVELPHRLRCIYAWADKAHQSNKVDSVLVESSFGRKRYVELSPKISLAEFREVQREHFSHLDRVGTEIIKSFREDLWVAQGKGRQNRELILSCAGYLVLVCAIDYVIIGL